MAYLFREDSRWLIKDDDGNVVGALAQDDGDDLWTATLDNGMIVTGENLTDAIENVKFRLAEKAERQRRFVWRDEDITIYSREEALKLFPWMFADD